MISTSKQFRRLVPPELQKQKALDLRVTVCYNKSVSKSAAAAATPKGANAMDIQNTIALLMLIIAAMSFGFEIGRKK